MSEQDSIPNPEPTQQPASVPEPRSATTRPLGTAAKVGLLAAAGIALVALSGIGGFAIGHATADHHGWVTMAGEEPGFDGPGTDRPGPDGDRHHRGPDGQRHHDGPGDGPGHWDQDGPPG